MRFILVFIFSLFCLATSSFAAISTLTESQVFEWWDDGIISAEEAQEMLDLLQEDNVHEACILAEIYALETCEATMEKPEKISKKRGKKKEPAAKKSVSGHLSWKAQTDSLGLLEKSNLNFQLSFYRFNLRLGTQELLTYKNKNAEAYFGQISTKEFHSHIPLDTLWGAALFYPIKHFRIGAALDTAKNFQGSISYSAGKAFDATAAYWVSPRQQSISLQAKSSWGEISIWQLTTPRASFSPLIKMELHNKGQSDKQTLSWKTVAYIHGDFVPSQSHLSKTLLKYKFWGSQNFNFEFSDSWNSKISANSRVAIPLDADTASTKIKLSAESGPSFFRGLFSVSCTDAENGCTQTNLRAKFSSQPSQFFAGHFTMQTQLTREKGFSLPRWELGTTYQPETQNSAKLSLVFPKGTPKNHIQIREEMNLATQTYPKIRCSLASTLEKKAETRLHPVHGFLQINLLF